MAQIVTNNFSIQNATDFVSNYTNNYYLLIGRPQNWAAEPTPDSPVNLPNEDYIYWTDSIAAKRIVSSDLKQVVKRNDYTTGVVYTQYDQRNANLLSTNFYVLTNQEFNVYKCISNNFGAASTVKPTGRSTSVFQAADGYRWKYMYSLTDADLLKFLTRDYMAININEDVVDTAVPGTIDNIVIQNQGNNYSTAVQVRIVGNGSGATVANISQNASNSITQISIDPVNIGTGYKFANVIIADTLGGNAVAYTVISPNGGHGSDPYYELGAKYVMINNRLDYAEGGGDFPVVNDYRRISVVKNPISVSTGNVATQVTLDSTLRLNLQNVTGTFSLDENIIGATTRANAFVVSANVVGTNVAIRYITPENLYTGNTTFTVGEIVTGNTSSATGIIASIVNREIQHNTGKVLYVENRSKITRQSDQAENIHIVIEF
jgi:KaiC/GvpD/RAD55 family RecA-like ATPase